MFAVVRLSQQAGGRAATMSSTSVMATTRRLLSSSTSDNKYYTLGLTGSNGLIGTALRDEIQQRGSSINGKPVRVVCLRRGTHAEHVSDDDNSFPPGESSLGWNPNGATPDEIIHPNALQQMDAMIHLSGENISTGQGPLGFLGIRPWTDSKKAEILNSRVQTTTALAKAIAANANKIDFLAASGVGAYGNHFIHSEFEAVGEASGDTEYAPGFLAEVSRQNEAAAQLAANNGRVVVMRNGVVLSKQGGAMAKLVPIFLLGGGGIVGSGQQYFPTISARDMARAMIHVLETPSLEGPVNLCAPNCPTNAEFTSAMVSSE